MDAPRDWKKTDGYYAYYLKAQSGHEGRGWADECVRQANAMIPADVKTTIDVGSGSCDMGYTAQADLSLGIDFHWLPFPDSSFDLVRARHALEHSPMPALALAEWRRVSAKYMLIIVPELSPYMAEYPGHWTCLPDYGWKALFVKCGLKLLQETSGPWVHYKPGTGEPVTMNEYRFLLKTK